MNTDSQGCLPLYPEDSLVNTDLHPGEEHHDGEGAVEHDLPVAEELEVDIIVR